MGFHFVLGVSFSTIRLAVSGLFLIFYSLFRTLVEFVRQPDAHMGDEGFIALEWLTMGMILSFPMLLLGLYLLWSSTPRLSQKVNTK